MPVIHRLRREFRLRGGRGVARFIASRLVRSRSDLLFEIAPSDPPTLIAVSCTLGSIAVLATMIPARRATRIAPVIALRDE